MEQLDKTEQGEIILYTDNDPVMFDKDGPWTYDVQTVVATEHGDMRTTTTLDRTL